MQHLRQEFSNGVLDLDIVEAALPPERLFRFAERENPHRSFLFVSTVLGRHIPARPSEMRTIHRRLADRIPLRPGEPAACIGMAETAIGLGAGVFRECGADLFLCTTRHHLPAPVLLDFQETHSHAADHRIHAPAADILRRPDLHLILVDDEMTTGATFRHLLDALADAGVAPARVTLAVITDWSGGMDLPENIRAVSLLRGTRRWTPLPGAPAGAFPDEPALPAHPVPLSPRQDWGRLGMAGNAPAAAADPWPDVDAAPGERVLVIGTGEFVWPPFLLAERLEACGADVRLCATTRSPIKPGMAVERILIHRDSYGLGRLWRLYNVDPAAWDRILLCCETPAGSVDPELARALGPGLRILEHPHA